MEITEVRVKLVERPSERLRAFCSITLDGDFVIRDLKIIGGSNGVFVAMPSRKLSDRCPKCRCKNHLRAKFCNDCGHKLNEGRAPKDGQGRAKLHADVAHPINAACRERIQNAVIEAYEAEQERAKSPDYRPPKYDDYEYDDDNEVEAEESPAKPPAEPEQDKEPAAEGEGFTDYNSLIADLKREAAHRHEKRRTHDWSDRDRPEREEEVPGGADEPDDEAGSDQEELVSADDESPTEEETVAPASVEQAGKRAERVPEPEPVASTQPSTPAPRSRPAPASEDDEDSGGFGAGLF